MPLTQIACLGLSHHTAPVALRERIIHALPEQHLLPAPRPEQFDALSELAILATCNRIELYAFVDASEQDPRQLLLDYLSQQHTVDTISFQDYLYFYQGKQTAEHLARVSAGLDSLVLGEPQILGQVTDAYMKAVEARTAGPALTTLFRSAIRAGKRARSETAISSNPATISSVCIALAENILGNLKERKVAIIGLGQMGSLALSGLRKRGVRQISLVNRSRERAERLNEDLDGDIFSLDEIPQALIQADVVICATAAPVTLIDKAMVRQVMAQRGGRPLVLIDIAVPRDVDTAVRQVLGVHLFNMDDLQETLDEALAARQKEVPKVEAIIAEEIEGLDREFRELSIQPVISDLRQKAEAIRQRELRRTLRHLGKDVDAETINHIKHLSHSLVNKLLHEPTLRLRQKATNGEAEEYAATVRDLFDLDAINET